MDLLLRDQRGEPQLIMQADESLYLHPDRARLPAAAMVVGKDDVPDVVLEVDHTTDARRGKLSLYESWGFPEVWVDVPDAPSPNRPPGLTIHLSEDGRYRVADESQAFPGWTAAEIHAALNEPAPSEQTSAVLERVGGALGAREGTGPDDDPLLRSQRRAGFERGRSEMVRQILLSRGIEVSEEFPAGAAGTLATASEAALLSAALAWHGPGGLPCRACAQVAGIGLLHRHFGVCRLRTVRVPLWSLKARSSAEATLTAPSMRRRRCSPPVSVKSVPRESDTSMEPESAVMRFGPCTRSSTMKPARAEIAIVADTSLR